MCRLGSPPVRADAQLLRLVVGSLGGTSMAGTNGAHRLTLAWSPRRVAAVSRHDLQ
jgi:hypothetical protein